MPGDALPSPLLGPPRPERADAARNRAAIVAAATELLAQGPEAVTMQDVADGARVGVGTLYRRFGDRRGLLFAVLDDGERVFQRAFLRGPGPLGPGETVVDPADRVGAFVHALLDHTLDDLDLRLALDPRGDQNPGPRPVWQLHLRLLCRALGTRRVPDPGYWSGALLALCDPALLREQVDAGATRASLHRAVGGVLDRLLRG